MKSNDSGGRFSHFIPVILILAFSLFSIVSLDSIHKLQGDARIINYTGIVRGASQRIVKQELNHMENDALIEELDKILAGLSEGDAEYSLSVLDSPVYQMYVSQMEVSWNMIKEEIQKVRNGEDDAKLYEMSEDYFDLANSAVSAAEAYSVNKVQKTTEYLLGLNLVFAVFIAIFMFFRKKQNKMSGELLAAEKASSEKSGFLSRMSHEIRTPMNGIMGMTDIALLSLNQPEKVADCLGKIKLSSEYLISLINDILDMSRIESGKIELYLNAFDIHVFADRISTMFSQKAQDAGLDFQVKLYDISSPIMIGDELRLSQIVVNLTSNAIKFTPEKGKVYVEIEEKAGADGEEDNDMVSLQITVTDTGIGMTEEFMTRMFEPFEQASSSTAYKYGGTGLGLSICYNLIQLMNGELIADSKEGIGSRFIVRLELPKAHEAVSVKERMMKRRITDFTGFHILLVEDNELNSEIATSMLEMKGATVDKAWTGKEAVEKFLHSEAGQYQMILMDMQMPEMNGMDACVAIRSSNHMQAKLIPIIGLSANAFSQDREEALKCGMNDYLAKPIDLDRLWETISGICNT